MAPVKLPFWYCAQRVKLDGRGHTCNIGDGWGCIFLQDATMPTNNYVLIRNITVSLAISVFVVAIDIVDFILSLNYTGYVFLLSIKAMPTIMVINNSSMTRDILSLLIFIVNSYTRIIHNYKIFNQLPG